MLSALVVRRRDTTETRFDTGTTGLPVPAEPPSSSCPRLVRGLDVSTRSVVCGKGTGQLARGRCGRADVPALSHRVVQPRARLRRHTPAERGRTHTTSATAAKPAVLPLPGASRDDVRRRGGATT